MSLVRKFNVLFSKKSEVMVVIQGKFFCVHTVKQCGRMESNVEVSGQYHVPAALSKEKEPTITLDEEIIGVQSICGRFRGTQAPAIQPRFPAVQPTD
jgi:hypothetical protein